MRIGKLHFKNFRGFENFELDLSENRLAVFVGENGSGKSTFLEAITELLAGKLLGYSTNKPFLSKVNKLAKPNEMLLKTEILSKTIGDSEIIIQPNHSSSIDFTSVVIGKLFKNTLQNIPILYYQGPNLGIYPSETISKKKTYPQFDIYSEDVCSTLFHENAFFEWFLKEEDIENEKRVYEDENFESKKLKTVRQALINFFDNNRFLNIRIKRQFDHKELVVELEKGTFNLLEISEGEKAIVTTIGNIARRLAIANPSLTNPLEGEGVVMIDEIDSHLHPKWQEEIVPALLRTFPNIQFLITTHSPHVVRNVQREELFILKNFKLEEGTVDTYTVNIENILYSAFGHNHRHPLMEQAINKIAKLIDEEKIEQATNELDKLAGIVGDLDPEVTHLRNMIDFW